MHAGEIAVRPLAAEDVPAIARIHADACRIAYRFMGWSYTLPEVISWYGGRHGGWDWGRVALTDGTPVGFVAMTSGLVDQLFVHPEAQRRGVGSALLGLAIGRGIRPVTLHVFEGNTPARRFYERHGFREAGRWFNEQDRAVELLYRLA